MSGINELPIGSASRVNMSVEPDFLSRITQMKVYAGHGPVQTTAVSLQKLHEQDFDCAQIT